MNPDAICDIMGVEVPLLLVLLTPLTAQAGPWVKGPGEHYLKAGLSRYDAANYVDPDGQTSDAVDFVSMSYSAYGEVGILKGLQGVFSVPWVDARNSAGDDIYVNRDLGDVEVGVETGRMVNNVPMSIQVITKLPGYNTGDLLQYRSGGFPALGDGQVDFTVWGAVGNGLSLGKVRGWASLEAGYRHRTEIWMGDSSEPTREYVDGVPFRAQLGWAPNVNDRSLGWLSADLSGTVNPTEDDVTRQWMQLGIGAAGKVTDEIAIEAGSISLFWADASATGQSYSVGISWMK